MTSSASRGYSPPRASPAFSSVFPPAFAALFLAVGTALVPVTEAAIARLSSGRWGLVAFGFLFGVLDAGLVLAVGRRRSGRG